MKASISEDCPALRDLRLDYATAYVIPCINCLHE
jgi:hypothetical protein